MRKLALLPFLLLAAALSFAPPAHALDFPALIDAGSLVSAVDGGFYAAVATAKTRGWAAAMRCSPVGVYYCASEGTCSGYCKGCPGDAGFCAFTSGSCSGIDGGGTGGTTTYLSGCSACPDDAGACLSAACVPTQSNLYLAPEVTYDIEMPAPYNQVGIKTFDGGTPSCNLFHNRRRGE